jgi:hypothetical protein
VLLLSADDYLLPGALSRATFLMDEHPEIGFVFGNNLDLDDTGVMQLSITEAWPNSNAPHHILSGSEFMQVSRSRNVVPTPTAVIRTTLQKRVGGYRVELPHTADMYMWLLLASFGSVGVVGAAQAVYRRHAANMSLSYRWLADFRQREAAIVMFIDECGERLANRNAIRRSMLQSLALDVVSAGSKAFNEGLIEQSTELLAYAEQKFPAVRSTRAWAKVSAKRLIGHSAWMAIKGPVRRTREKLRPS